MKTAVLTAALACACALSVAGAELSSGKVEVVLAAKPTRVAQFAAEEMTNFLSRVLGADVPIVKTPTAGMAQVFVGTGADVSGFARDEFVIKAEPGRVVIAGRDSSSVRDDPKSYVARGWTVAQWYERATLFGVYEFLERFAGCRFYFPGELGEIAPRRSSIAVPDGEMRVRPDMMARRVYSGGGSKPKAYDGLWFEDRPKNSDGKALNWLRLRMETECHPCCHGLNKFNYLDRFGKTKPEYFALLTNGTRSNNPKMNHPGQLCLTSGIYEEIYQDVRAYFKGEKASTRGLKGWGNNCVGGRYVDIMCQDGMAACHCPNCQAEYARCAEIYGKDPDYANNWATELVWSNTCRIARRLTEEGIKGTVTQMAYFPYRHVPRMEIPGNVDVMVAEHGPWSVLYPDKMKLQVDEIKSWADKLGRPVWIWTYPGKYGSQAFPGIPHVTPKCIGVFYKAAAPYIFGSFMESESDRFLYNYLNYYVVSRIFWDKDVDVDAVLAEHYDLMFGPAAPEMRAFFEALEEKWTHEVVGKTVETALGPTVIRATDTMLWGEIYSPAVIAEYDALLARAAAKVPAGSLEARRVALFRREFFDGLSVQMKAFHEKQAKVKALVWNATKDPAGALVVDHVFGSGKAPEHPVAARVTAWKTASDLVVEVDCDEPRMSDAVAVDRAFDDGEIWKDNGVELFLNVSGDRRNYYHFFANSRGSFTDMMCVKAGAGFAKNDISWNSGGKVAVSGRPGGWKATFTIPLKAFPSVLGAFPADVLRNRVLNDGAEYYNWSPYTRGVDQLENYGTFDFEPCARPVELRPGKAEVVIAADAPKTVKFAASEMADLLGGCLGVDVPVVNSFTEGRAAIVLGDNEWTRAAGIHVAGMKRDAYSIVSNGRIFIAGRDDPEVDVEDAVLNGGVWGQMFERGTLFGVYEFLERFAGVRMYFPGELGTITPRTAAVRVPAGRIDDAPAYDMARRYSAFWDGEYPEELAMKRGRTKFAERVRQLYRNRCTTQYIPCCHGSNGFFYTDRFGKSHPEYFALVGAKGERSLPGCTYPHHLGQLCWTSGVVDEMYKDLASYLKGEDASVRGIPAYGKTARPGSTAWHINCQQRKYVDVMPQDGFVGCKCENCKAAYSKTDNVHFATELIWGNTVKFANRLKAEGIPGYVVMMAYRPYRRVPDFDIPDNVLVQVAETGPWSTSNPAALEKENAEIRAWVKKLGHKVWLWNYTNKGSTLTMPNIPQMSPHAYGEYYSSLEPWISGAFAESESDRFIYNYLNYYVFGKVCWNPKRDWKGLIAEHHRLMFGPAEGEMKEFYDILERKWTREVAGRVVDTPLGPVGAPPSQYDIWTKVYSPDVLAGLRGLLDAAAAKVAAGSLEARRIALMRRHVFDNLLAESRKYLDRIDPRVEESWRAAHPGLHNVAANFDFSVGRIGASHAFGKMSGKEMVGWYGSRNPSETDLDTKVFRSAPSSMRITQRNQDLSKNTISGITQYITDGARRLKPNTRYRYSFFPKLEGVTPLKRGGGVIARVWDDRNLWFPSATDGGPLTGTTDWIAQSYEFTSGPKTNDGCKSYMGFEIRQATGTVWVDDVRLEELGAE